MLRNPNHTDQTADRGGGGGYLYEWELGAEVALVALQSEFVEDWRCLYTEVPIPVRLREWLGLVRAVRFEAGHRSKKILEDLNLHGAQARELHIQVKSGKGRLDTKTLKKVLRRFQALDESDEGTEKRYLLIAEAGVVHDLHLRPTTLGETLLCPPTKEIERFRARHLSALVRDKESLLNRVWLVRGPTFQRVAEKNLFLCGRLHGYDCGSSMDRRRALTLRDSLGAKLNRAASSEGVVLTRESLQRLIDTPPRLVEIAAELRIVVPPEHPLCRLDELLGWRLCDLGAPLIRHFLSEVKDTTELGDKALGRRLRDACESAYFSATGNEAPHFQQLLAIRRLLALLFAEFDTSPLFEHAEKGQSEALATCWLALGTTVKRQGGLLFVGIRRPPSRLATKLQEACRRLLQQQTELIDDAILEDVIVNTCLAPAEPAWLPSREADEENDTNPPFPEQQLEPKGLAMHVQSMANIAGQSAQAAKFAETELRRILEDCRSNGRLALMISVAEKLSSCLLEQGKSDEAMSLLLEVSEDQAVEAGSNLFYRFHERQLSSLEKGTKAWANYKNLEALMALRRGHLIEMSKSIKELDPNSTVLLTSETGALRLKVRLAEIRGVLIHRSAREAEALALQLLYRIPRDWKEARLKLLLLLVHAAYWDSDPAQMSAAWSVVQSELSALEEDYGSNCDYQALAVHHAHLQWLLAQDTDDLTKAFRRWEELETELTHERVWSCFQIVRTKLEFRRRVFRGELEVSRRAAVDSLSHDTGGRKALRNSHAYYSSGSWTSALESAYTALDASLLENDWPLLEEARLLLTQLWLKDGQPIRAVRSFVRIGSLGVEKTMVAELAGQLDEAMLDEVFMDLLERKDGPSQHRAWRLLVSLNELLTVDQRNSLIAKGRESLLGGPRFQEDYFAQNALFELLSKFLRCPSSRDESVRLLTLFLKRFRESKDDTTKTETLRQIRRGFWSSTGMHPASEAGLQFLDQLEKMLPDLEKDSDKKILFDIILGLGFNANEVGIATRARSILTNCGADAMLAKWDAHADTPAPEDTELVLSTVLRRASERITRGLEEARLVVSASSLTEISPFVEHLTDGQLKQLFVALTDAALDAETEAGRRWDALQVLRDPTFQRLPNTLLDSARRLFFSVLEGHAPMNMFDRHREEMNRSVFTGMTFDPDHEHRVQKTVCEALGGFHAKSTKAELSRYFGALLALTETTKKVPSLNAAQSLQVFFQSDGHADSPELQALLVRLLTHGADAVRARATEALGEMVYNEKDLSDTLKLLVELAIPRSYHRFEIRKGLAVFSRLSLRLAPEHPHRQFVEQLNAKLRHDRNPVVQRYADVRFWTLR